MRKYLFVSLILLFLSSCSEKNKLYTLKGGIFGTYYVIKVDAKQQQLNNLKKGMDSVFLRVNKSLNTYLPYSDISKINKGDSTIVVDNLFKDVYLLSKEINIKTEGLFDPTVGVLRNNYGFGDTKPIQNFSDKKLDSLMKYVGLQKVRLMEDGRVIKKYPQIYFDFNSIAKGYALDKIVEYLSSKNIKNCSVEIGGEIRVLGKNSAKNKLWTIGIESLDSKLNDRKTRAVIQLTNKSIAGSGNFRKFRVDSVSGKKYVHTINPITGKAEQGNILSTYVLADTCAKADGYATAFMVMGIDKTKKLIPNLSGIDVYIVYVDEKGKTQTFITEGFKSVMIN